MKTSIFALLPIELVRLVLEFSAQESSQTAARLLRVSKVVNEWVHPLLYETFVLDVSTLGKFFMPQYDNGTSIIISPPKSFAPWVRNMCINFPDTEQAGPHLSFLNPGHAYVYNKQDVYDFIKACIHVSNLYLDIGLDDFRSYIDMPAAVSRFPPPSLSTTLTHLHCATWESWLFTSRFLELLPSLTHLRLDITYDTSIFRTFMPVFHRSSFVLPSLTHFAIGADSRSGGNQLRATANLARTVSMRQGMHMIVISAWYCWDSTSETIQQAFLETAEEAGAVMKEKVCILEMGGSLDGGVSVKEWENEARGKQSIWSRARKLLDVQARGRTSERQGIAMGSREL